LCTGDYYGTLGGKIPYESGKLEVKKKKGKYRGSQKTLSPVHQKKGGLGYNKTTLSERQGAAGVAGEYQYIADPIQQSTRQPAAAAAPAPFKPVSPPRRGGPGTVTPQLCWQGNRELLGSLSGGQHLSNHKAALLLQLHKQHPAQPLLSDLYLFPTKGHLPHSINFLVRVSANARLTMGYVLQATFGTKEHSAIHNTSLVADMPFTAYPQQLCCCTL